MNGRRGFLRSACGCGLGVLGGALLAQERAGLALPPRFKRPALDTDEAGLWGLMDREEMRIKRSPLTIRHQLLNRYLSDLVCRLAEGHCPDIRVHAVRMPHFNALMAPNGMMLVWSGLLLRVENEAQLVAVLGHELGHYVERHQVEQLRAAKDRAVLAHIVGLVGGVGSVVGQIGLLASAFAFSREHEARADRVGVRLMRQAGYDAREAAAVWGHLLEEMKVTGGEEAGKRGDLFATHPTSASRRDELLQLAGPAGGDRGEERLRAAVAPLRPGWLRDEIKRGQYEESLVLFNRLLRRDPGDGELLYARGEVYRLRADPGDADLALADLHQAAEGAQPPPEVFRSAGLVYQERGDAARATDAFRHYLSLAPQAPDAGLVRSYLGAGAR